MNKYKFLVKIKYAFEMSEFGIHNLRKKAQDEKNLISDLTILETDAQKNVKGTYIKTQSYILNGLCAADAECKIQNGIANAPSIVDFEVLTCQSLSD